MKKVILFLWFGDEKPSYIQWTLENFRKINPGWEIRYIEYSNKQLIDYKNQNDPVLAATSPNKCFSFWVDDYKGRYLDMHKDEFVIYCDLDCFPIAPFDNFIIKQDDPNVYDWYKDQHRLEHLEHSKYLGLWSQCLGIHNDAWCLTNNNALHTDFFLQICKYSIPDDDYTIWGSMLINKNDIPKYDKRNEDFQKMNLKLGDNFCLQQFTPIEHYYQFERNSLNLKVTLN